jgi:hypothetical protein
VIKEDDGFFSNLFVKWKSNPVFGKKQDEGEANEMQEAVESD